MDDKLKFDFEINKRLNNKKWCDEISFSVLNKISRKKKISAYLQIAAAIILTLGFYIHTFILSINKTYEEYSIALIISDICQTTSIDFSN